MRCAPAFGSSPPPDPHWSPHALGEKHLIVVTGATGHAGANLVRALLSRGDQVRALTFDQHNAAIDGLPVERMHADVCQPAALDLAFAGAEVVYHLAAAISIHESDGPLLERVNVVGTRNVVSACLRRGVRRLVHFSSVQAIAETSRGAPLDEDGPLSLDGSACAYDRSKARGELEIRAGVERGLDAVIVAPTAVIGPNDHRISGMGSFFVDVARGRLPSLMGGGFNWVDVRDVAEGALLAEAHGVTGHKYILGGEWASVPSLANEVCRATGARPPRLVVPLWLVRTAVPLADRWSALTGMKLRVTGASVRMLESRRDVRIDKARRVLGYSPRPLAQTVTDAVRWHAEAGNLKS